MTTDSDALRELDHDSDTNAVHMVQHYLYISSESCGKDVTRELRRRGFDVEDRLGSDGVNWLVLATRPVIPTETAIAELRQFFESIASKYGGEYDGWEAKVRTYND